MGTGAWLLIAGSVFAAPEQGEKPAVDLSNVIGVTHVGGLYCPYQEEENFLVHGAKEILALGSRTVKLWFTKPQTSYPYHSDWPEHFDSLVAMAEAPYYRAVFAMPFDTIILLVYSLGRPEHYWRGGCSPEELADERRQFHGLAAHLFARYRGSGKTFILQHWEGDWAIRGKYDPLADPTEQEIAGMIAWLNARQDGVDQARQEAGGTDVAVYHAAEVNLVYRAMKHDAPNVTNRVLPHTHLDLVSYSSWDTAPRGKAFGEALDYIAQHMPDKAPFGAKNVYVGEFGMPENDPSLEKHQEVVRNVVDTGLAWGCPYLVYWQLYCNEAKQEPVKTNEDCRGFWLIKPDGTKAWAWHYFRGLLEEGRPDA